MVQVVVSPKAREDLVAIRQYIQNELGSPDAARRILQKLKDSMLSLESMPQRGTPLDAVLPFHTDYRFLVCDRYTIFYTVSGAQVQILRVLHQLQDCMKVLFPSK